MSAWVAMVRVEALKVRTVRASLAVALALVLLEVLFKTISVVLLQEGAGPVEVLGALRPSISFPVVCAVLGVLPAAAEWRHGTAAPTYSVQPRRTVVLGAKTVVAAVVGATGGLLATATALTATLVVAAQRGLATPAPSQVAATALGSVGAALLLAALGVAVGTLLRDQTGAWLSSPPCCSSSLRSPCCWTRRSTRGPPAARWTPPPRSGRPTRTCSRSRVDSGCCPRTRLRA